ncbi:FAD-binding domain-containing protein [Plenodomus tracheiphilus IPT5]|uniref:FAD-binding domain-containing protein n=1 Tax=Plenodomus tracheiphilus IPT5 TaxID=1408161 RepID=A0A6A7ATN6_9PLEO|nr:FAD-binding domain-containing protein [Plenodomus tracheiphilus IPT5]
MKLLTLPSLLLAVIALLDTAQCRILFQYERQQLTREFVASLPADEARLFAFGDQFEAKAINTTEKQCRHGPTDKKWPSEKGWGKLRNKLSSANALIASSPQASVCYGTSRNDASCQQLTRNWTNSYTHIDDPTEVLSPIYQGLTCQPPTIYDSGTCKIGGYPSYVVKAKTVSDIQSTVNFARNDGVRLIVKNTGHDFAGKSAGYGALSIWTHGLKELLYMADYVDESGYRGPAIKAGAGVQAFELYKFANDKGVVAVAGEGQTVGVMGGYILGGGHSPLSSIYGMAADHVLGFEIVTPIGEFVTANSSSFQDLFWALRGGGGGTFGVVTSVTVKAYQDMPVSAASWALDSSKIGKDKFWAATKAFFDRAIDNVDAGTYSYLLLVPTGQDFALSMQPFLAPNKTASQLNSILAPYLSKLTALNIPFSPKVTEYRNFYPAWQAEFPLEPQSSVSSVVSSRLFPRSNFASETGRNVTFNVVREAVEAGQVLIAFNMATRGSNPDNAVNPAWRNSVYHIITGISVNHTSPTADIMAARGTLTNGTMQKWRDVTPGSGAYLNEADRLEPNWQQSFFGDKYARLLEIKKDMDHRNIFWAHQAVGSEGWRVVSFDGLPNENGKLCQV